MRVSGRALVLGFLAITLAPAAASAAPILVGGGSASACTFGSTTVANCSLFALDPFSADPAWEGTFEDPSDVALFSFTFDEAARLTVSTSSWAGGSNFDPTLGLFHGDGTILELPDGTPARFFDIDIFANYDDHLDVELGAGTYLLALAIGNLRESLLAGFDCDFGCEFGAGAAFAFEASASPLDGTAPIPEPATLTLVAGGALAGWLQRRRTKTRKRTADSR